MNAVDERRQGVPFPQRWPLDRGCRSTPWFWFDPDTSTLRQVDEYACGTADRRIAPMSSIWQSIEAEFFEADTDRRYLPRGSVTETSGVLWPLWATLLACPTRLPAGTRTRLLPVTLFFCDDTVWSQTTVEAMHPGVHVKGDDG